MGGREGKERYRRPRKLHKRLIVVCEGRKTEYFYFSSLRTLLVRAELAALKVIPGRGSTPIDVVQLAIRHRDADIAEGIFEEGDRVYALIDVDPHDRSKEQPLDTALQMARNSGIQVLLSNPSFEVWILCHVLSAAEMKRSFVDPDAVNAELKNRLGFGKDELNANPHRFNPIVKRVREAVTVACEVRTKHFGNCTDSRKANACTEVYTLVDYLLGQSLAPP